MDFINYGRQWIDKTDEKAVLDVMDSDLIAQGPKVEEFEKALCKKTGVKYCVVVSNGTAALHLAVLSLDIEKGSEGITSPNTFVASANCMLYNNLKPVLADIDEKTYNIDPKEILKKINRRTKLIIPVHFAGQVAEMREISKIAISRGKGKHHLFVIEDAAHALGSKYPDGGSVGNCKYSDMTTFSFHPVKTITTGEGGAITTNNRLLYKKLLLLRSHGITKNLKDLNQSPGPWYYEMQDLGFNYRLTDIQAALGISQLKKLEKFVKVRRKIVRKYNQSFSSLSNVIIPYEKTDNFSAFHLYVIQIDFEKIGKSRKQVIKELDKKGIGTQVHYIPVYTQPYYKKVFGNKEKDFPVTEKYYENCLSLPLYPKMTDNEVNYVIKEVKNVIRY